MEGGDLKVTIDNSLERISAELLENWRRTDLGLLSGKAGICLFLFYYGRAIDSREHSSVGAEILEDIFENIADISSVAYSDGLAGIGWLIEHLDRNDFVEIDTKDILKDVDEVIFEWMIAEMNRENFDFLYGAAGAVHYFLSKRIEKNTYLKEFLRILNEKASIFSNPKFIVWQGFDLLKNEKAERFNLGLSHGMASLLILLVQIGERSICKENTDILIQGLISFFRWSKLDPDVNNCYFGSFIDVDRQVEEVFPSRFAWCYGDLGICVALWKAGKYLNDDGLKMDIIEIMKFNSTRIDMSTNHVYDACLCHGTAGIASIFDYFYLETKMAVFKESSIYWLKKSLYIGNYHSPGDYNYYDLVNKIWIKKYGLLEGTSGIGLYLTANPNGVISWQNCLMIADD
jgi:lantibiotic modifying enzyme